MAESHPVRVETEPRRVKVTAGGSIVADSSGVLMLYEATYPRVRYFPRRDVDMTKLCRSPHKTVYPLQGRGVPLRY